MEIKLKNQILKKIKPSKIEHDNFNKIIIDLVKKLEIKADEVNFNCDFFLGGSFGKNTYLKGSFDVDIFCRFDLSYDNNDLSKNLKLILDEL